MQSQTDSSSLTFWVYRNFACAIGIIMRMRAWSTILRTGGQQNNSQHRSLAFWNWKVGSNWESALAWCVYSMPRVPVTVLCAVACCTIHEVIGVLIATNAISTVSLCCVGAHPQWRLNEESLDFGELPPTGLTFSIGANKRSVKILQDHVLAFNGSLFQCSPSGSFVENVSTNLITVYGNYIILYIYYNVVCLKFDICTYRSSLKAR